MLLGVALATGEDIAMHSCGNGKIENKCGWLSIDEALKGNHTVEIPSKSGHSKYYVCRQIVGDYLMPGKCAYEEGIMCSWVGYDD